MDLAHLLDFLKRLKKNNHKEWFDRNKKEYDDLRKSWIGFADELIADISRFDPSLAGVEGRGCIFRINRDVRFSKDKSPYKTNFGASMNPGGKLSSKAGYYVHIQPGECFAGGGVYMPEPEALAQIRQEIDYNADEFRKIVEDKNFRKQFGKLDDEGMLSRPPKGYEADNPAIDFLKHKNFVAFKMMPDKDVSSAAFKKEVIAAYKALHPMNMFLNRATE